jgi:co-chaperonin GroES (HSP10)
MLRPTSNNLVVVHYQLPEESPGGIVIPDAYREDGTGFLWEVVAVGPGRISRKGTQIEIDARLQPGTIVEADSRWVADETGVLDDQNRMQYILNESQIAMIRG